MGIGVTAVYYVKYVYFMNTDIMRKVFKENIVSIIAD